MILVIENGLTILPPEVRRSSGHPLFVRIQDTMDKGVKDIDVINLAIANNSGTTILGVLTHQLHHFPLDKYV